MKKIFKMIPFIAIFIIACQENKQKEISIEKNNNPTQLHVSWNLLENNHDGQKKYLSHLTITNTSKVTLKKNWELFFSYSPCRDVLKDKLPASIQLTHINGDLYSLAPTEQYTEIAVGDSLIIPILASEWVIKEGDAPNGFYFIFNHNDTEILNPSRSVYPLTSVKQLTQTKEDVLPVPTAESIYKNNERLSILAKEKIQLITPTPLEINAQKGTFTLNAQTQIMYNLELENEISLLQHYLKEELGLDLEIDPKKGGNQTIITLALKASKKEENLEAYELSVQEKEIKITAPTARGIFYGVQSLKALIPIESFQKNQEEINIQAVEIKDQPRFAYRGMHLDVSRNFQSKESVLKMLDVMSFYKLNKFHFHLTDDEGWRLEISSLPELTEIGAKRVHTRDEKNGLIHQYGSASSNAGSGYYSRQDFIEILKFAKARHIEVIPEIDMPGHARAAIKSMKARYENYLAQGDSIKALEFVLHDPNDQSVYSSVQNFNDNVVCVGRKSTYNFLEEVVNKITEMYKEAEVPLTTIHTGGDEVPIGTWEKSPLCQALVKDKNNNIENVHGLKAYFLNKFSQIISEKGLKTAGWEEIALHLEAVEGQEKEKKTVNPEYVKKSFQPYVWNSLYGGGEELGYQMANAGYQVVLSNVTHFYLDMAYDKQPEEPGLYWGGFLNDEQPYLFEPYNLYNSLQLDKNGNPISKEDIQSKTPLTAEGKKNILGLQGQIWSETIKTADRLEYMAYPRMLSLAERAWATRPTWVTKREEYTNSWNEFSNRLGQRELPRFDYSSSKINYHIPTAGAQIKEGQLYANSALPGMDIRYTTDGTIPTIESSLYKEPITVTGIVKIAVFDKNGRKGLVKTIK